MSPVLEKKVLALELNLSALQHSFDKMKSLYNDTTHKLRDSGTSLLSGETPDGKDFKQIWSIFRAYFTDQAHEITRFFYNAPVPQDP
jgi:hypothetical protein